MDGLRDLVAEQLGCSPAGIDLDADFIEQNPGWADEFGVHRDLESWIVRNLQLGAFYPNELKVFSTIRLLSEYLAVESAPHAIEEGEDGGNWVTPGWVANANRECTGIYLGRDRVADPTVFIIGTPRCGSTLLRAMLAGHPEINAPPELNLLEFDTLGQWRDAPDESFGWAKHGLPQALQIQNDLSLEASYVYAAKLAQKNLSVAKAYQLLHSTSPARWLAEKSPRNATSLAQLQRLEQIFVEPRYIFLTRHPAAMIESIVRMRLERLYVTRNSPLRYNRWARAEWIWFNMNRNCVEFCGDLPQSRWLQLRYEDLVGQPEESCDRICELLDLEVSPPMLDPYGNKEEKMLEGVGDVNQAKRTGIDPSLADEWRKKPFPHKLKKDTRILAEKLGYAVEPEL